MFCRSANRPSDGCGSILSNGSASPAISVLGLRWRLFDFHRTSTQIVQAKGHEAEVSTAIGFPHYGQL